MRSSEAFDYDGWAQRPGLAHWSYAHCLPYFMHCENRLQGADDYHGSGGPLAVTTPSMRNPLFHAFVEAAQQAGYAYTRDMNGFRQEGFGPMDQTTLRGRRWSTMRAYLRPAMWRPNLRVLPRCLALRVVFEGRRAAGGFFPRPAGGRRTGRQYRFLPMAADYDGKEKIDEHGFQAHVGPMRPTSSGSVRLRSSEPRQHPAIQFNYLQTEGDRAEMRAAVRLTREILAQHAFDPFRGRELRPGPDVVTDAQMDAFARARAESAYHPSCSCAMGSDSRAVVDGELRVRGVEALRVVDASGMPAVVSGNLSAPTIMRAEQRADLIRARRPLEPMQVPVFEHPNYRTAQR